MSPDIAKTPSGIPDSSSCSIADNSSIAGVTEDLDKLHLNGPVVNGFADTTKGSDTEETYTTSDCSPCSKSPKSVVRSRAERRLEARHRAMVSLAPRFQPVSHECSVMSCLNQFTAAELLTGNNKFRCGACTRLKYNKQDKKGNDRRLYISIHRHNRLLQLMFMTSVCG